MEERIPVPGEFYRHFKNKFYQVLCIAIHSETKEEMVVYQALYGNFGVYVRPLSMFVSEVDKVRYPSVTQKYRFEKISANEIGIEVNTGYDNNENYLLSEKSEGTEEIQPDYNNDFAMEAQEEDDLQPNMVLMEFLDLDSYRDKLSFLKLNKNKLDNDIIDAMAASLDVVVPDGDINSRFISLRNCIEAHAKYECMRLR